MKNEVVVKTNRLNQAIQSLTLAELRIIQVAIVDARETCTGLSTDKPLRIEASRYANAFDIAKNTAYEQMKSAEDTLFNRRFTIIDTDGKPVKSRWIQDAKYFDGEGVMEITLTRVVVDNITRINGTKEFFTAYSLQQVANLNSVYSARLYELLAQWKSVGKTNIVALDLLRGQLGISSDEYKRMDHFKVRVLDRAVNEINENTDITVHYEQHKKGRIIIGFSFKFKQKGGKDIQQFEQNHKDQNTPDLFFKMTEAQLNMFSNKLAYLPELGNLAEGNEGYPELAHRIKRMLVDPEQQEQFKPHLEKLGFKF